LVSHGERRDVVSWKAGVEMQNWLVIAIAVLLGMAVWIARGALAWRRGAVLLVVAVSAVAGVEALVRAGVLRAADAGGVVAALAIGVVLLATVLRQISRPDRSSPQ
jgi:hypothetical protein